MSKINAKELLKKYAEGNCSPEERALVETYYNKFKAASGNDLPEQELENNLDSIWKGLPVKRRGRQAKLWYGISAAVVLIVFSAGLYFYTLLKHSEDLTGQASVVQVDVPP